MSIKVSLVTEEMQVVGKGVTVQEAAELLDVHFSSVYNAMARRNKVKGHHVVRAGDEEALVQVYKACTARLMEDIEPSALKPLLKETIAKLKEIRNGSTSTN